MSLTLKLILFMSRFNPPPRTGGVHAVRAWFEKMNAAIALPKGVTVERVVTGPCEADLIHLPGAQSGRLIIYFHGGGFVMGSARSHRVIAAHLARISGCAVLSPDYRLAPEHVAPTAHEDAFAVYKWALAQGYAGEQIGLSGDSAGGNLALSTAVRARDHGLPRPAALFVMSPALDLGRCEVAQDLETDPILTPDLLHIFNTAYSPDGDLKSAAITPIYSPCQELPPVLFHVGSWERLRNDSELMAAKLRASDVEAHLKVWDGMCHSWQLFAPLLREGMVSIEEGAAFLKARLS